MSDSDLRLSFEASTDEALDGLRAISEGISDLADATSRASSIMKSQSADAVAGALGAYRTMSAQLASGWSAGLSALVEANDAANARMTAGDGAAANQIVSIETRAIESRIRGLRAELREAQIVLDAGVAQHRISQDRKYAALEEETEKEYQAELALLEKEQGLAGLKVSQALSIEDKISARKRKNAEDMLRLDERSVAASQQAWTSCFAALEGAFDSQVAGLIRGTTRWSDAFRNVLGDLLVKFIETAERMALQWAAGELAQTAATTSGAAARSAATIGAAASSSAAMVASVLRSIAASAAETFAGIFGFLAPVMGPAAVGPAAAGQASVEAAAAGVAAFAQGSWSLPADMLAQVHKGEMIVPAAQTPWAQSLMANAARAGSAAGDVHVHHATHFNVSAMDSRDVRRWISDNGRTILDTINASVRNGAHLGLSKLG